MGRKSFTYKSFEFVYEVRDAFGTLLDKKTDIILAENIVDAIDRIIQTLNIKYLRAIENLDIDIIDIHRIKNINNDKDSE